tara:strand:+ start:181 stop:1935 length:1755 start_codon:yes stop_codon:yes gene_type:complete
MPQQIIPITDLASAGLVQDTPAVSLPPNVFSDVHNVRFRDGAVKRFPSDLDKLTLLTDVVYVAYWPSTLGDRYVVITDNGSNTVFTVYSDSFSVVASQGGTNTGVTGGTWQHTLFNGGYHIILNNGNSTPVFLQDDIVGVNALPGWDSYAVEEEITSFEHDGSSGAIEIKNTAFVNPGAGNSISVKITSLPRNTAEPIHTETVTINSSGVVSPDSTLANIGTISGVDFSLNLFNFTPDTSSGGTVYKAAITTAAVTAVTAGVVRSYGNLLVAGNLKETGGRTLTGTVRTSDVAAPGVIPENWNPFKNGANTADEFILASTGTIQDLAELQGVLYVYTDSSIHSIQQTNSPVVPFQIATVTDNYGVNNTDGVIEVDGKHIVYGSNDCYSFGGHPGSIASISDGRVRNFFRNNTTIKAVRFNKYDEIWFWSSSIVYVWNYRNNVWTKRDLPTGTNSMDSIRGDLLLSAPTKLLSVNGSNFLSGAVVERRRMAVTPEFNTESVSGMALLFDGPAKVNIKYDGIDKVGETVDFTVNTAIPFDTTTDYKADVRFNGRFLNYRIESQSNEITLDWNLTGYQIEIRKGGNR